MKEFVQLFLEFVIVVVGYLPHYLSLLLLFAFKAVSLQPLLYHDSMHISPFFLCRDLSLSLLVEESVLF